MIRRWILLTAALIFLIDGASAVAQSQESVLSALKPRDIGPALMGGRVSDFAVYDADSSLFYAALASGGLLKTVNAGASWENVFANQNSVSIGDVAINPTDPNTVWVGTGEANSRQSSSWGDGIYKSTDGGNTWTHLGLEESHYIGRIVINPVDTDIVYAAALGHLWGANAERGVYMTTDGGLTWKNVLSIDADTGAVDLAMDPFNPKILYAAMYQRRRTSWGFNGGGAGSGIYKTADGGRTWKKLTNGLPPGDNGRIGLDIYRANPNVVVAIVENKDGGVFRSEDKGGTWTKMNSLNPRPMYLSQIRIDPNDDSRIYVGGVQLHVSDDGGKTFRDDAAPNVHLDHHAFWIDPRNSNHLIDGNDGGIWVSYDRSKTWEHLNNYPIGQFYTVAVDMQQPYSVYGGMQDNASWGGPSSVRRRLGIMNQDWFQIQPCDGMYVAVDQKDAGSVYSDCQNGYIIRYDLKTGERKTIRPEAEPGERLRWNWTSPIVVSPHDSALYIGANRLFRSTDHGHTWSAVSPDLTTKTNRETLPVMNVADKNITLSKHDGMTSFGNITTVSESAKRAGLIYVGTDDGKVQVTRDGGQNWTDLTARIAGVPKMLYVSRVFASSFEDGRVYASLDGHRSDDFNPYVYVSTDFGQTWKSIRANLPAKGPVYVIKEDTKNPDLLFVGTEFGLFASLDRGVDWNAWKSLPTVAVYDLVVHPRDYDLVVATHGRSIQVFDDISPLQQMKGQVPSDSHLFDIRAATEFIPSESGWFTGGREYVCAEPGIRGLYQLLPEGGSERRHHDPHQRRRRQARARVERAQGNGPPPRGLGSANYACCPSDDRVLFPAGTDEPGAVGAARDLPREAVGRRPGAIGNRTGIRRSARPDLRCRPSKALRHAAESHEHADHDGVDTEDRETARRSAQTDDRNDEGISAGACGCKGRVGGCSQAGWRASREGAGRAAAARGCRTGAGPRQAASRSHQRSQSVRGRFPVRADRCPAGADAAV